MIEKHRLTEMALGLINSQSTMSLATARENRAWAAPVYYVYFKSAFYFFSSPDSRHIKEAMDCEEVSAAVYPAVALWQDIKGIQMSGSINKAGIGFTAMGALRAYNSKYPFIREFFESGETLDLESFEKRFKVRFYRFNPSLIYYLDNQIKFGFRIEVDLS
jgi:uncharacterized protein YhbP (UPF0306 family)